MSKKSSGFFAVLQKVGKSLMLPVSVLPAAGLMVAFSRVIEQLVGAEALAANPVLDIFVKVLFSGGLIVFENLPLIFAVGVAIGFTAGEAVSGLAAVVGYVVLIKVLDIMSAAQGLTDPINMGVFSGIIIGIISAKIYLRFFKTKLHPVLGFFEGKRLVPIIMVVTSILLGVVLGFVWPPIQNGINLMNPAGTETYYDRPEVIEAVQFWVDLSRKQKVHPEGIVEWGTTPKDFFERKMAMMWTTTGNLTNVRANAKFDFGVAMLPAGKQRGSPTGGGNFYVFKKSTPAQREAAFKFIKWVTQPARAAQWSIDTGYVAPSQAAYDTPAMKKYVSEFPAAAVARDQLPFAKAELSTHDNQRVTKALNDGLQAALTGTKTPEAAMKDAQREAERLLRSFQR